MHHYRLAAGHLEISSAEKALGLLMATKLAMNQQLEGQWPPWLHWAEHSHQIDEGNLTPMHNPSETHLECCVQCWVSQYRRDTDILKWVQRMAVKGHLTNEQRLGELGLFNLKVRRFVKCLCGDNLFSMYKYVIKHSKEDKAKAFFTVLSDRMSINGYKMKQNLNIKVLLL